MLISCIYRKRNSVYAPATVYDLPPDVIMKFLTYLLPRRVDLVASTLVCRSWHVFGRRLLNCKVLLDHRSISRLCGMQLKSILLGVDALKVVCLDVKLRNIGEECLRAIARLVSPFLYFLRYNFYGMSAKGCFEILEVFFVECREMRKLALVYFDFGNGQSSQIFKTGFSCMTEVSLDSCVGNLPGFIV
jgi:hypothetical protein